MKRLMVDGFHGNEVDIARSADTIPHLTSGLCIAEDIYFGIRFGPKRQRPNPVIGFIDQLWFLTWLRLRISYLK